MQLLPQSMFGRLLGSVLVAIAITLLIIVLLVLQDRRELALRVGGTTDTALRVAEISRSLAAMEPADRAQALKTLGESPTVLADSDRSDPRPPPPPHDSAAIQRSIAARVREQLGDGYTVSVGTSNPENSLVIRLVADEGFRPAPTDMQGRMDPPPVPKDPHAFGGPDPPPGGRRGGPHGGPGGGLLDIAITLADGDHVVFRVPAPRPEPPVPMQLFAELGILAIVLAIVLYLVTRNITRPLSALAQAADATGRSVHHPALPEMGVREIRNVTRAFNTMQDRLLRYLDSRSRVLAAMSHDLRTPLTRMRLRVEKVENRALSERFNADLDEMEALVNGALGLFKGLDDQEAFEATDLNLLLATLEKEFAELGSKVVITGRAQEALSVKPRALKRALSNLIANAIKFGSRAEVHVEDGPEVVIRVADDGPGIPSESLDQVFEPFFRLEASRNRDSGGAGLGLTIVRDVLQAHGGTVALRNLAPHGLEAVIILPRTRVG